MNTLHLQDSLGLPRLTAALRRPQRFAPRVPAAAVAGGSWLERLAAWAERQPHHRRLGSYTQWR
jgi:hypothetical protein